MSYGEPLNRFQDYASRGVTDILARAIYSEARKECDACRRGVGYIANNRRLRNSKEFGGGTWKGVLLKDNAFSGLKDVSALRPDTNSKEWKECLNIALNLLSLDNPIGGCLWYNANKVYSMHIKNDHGKEAYSFNGKKDYKIVTEKYIIGNYTFFKISGS